MPFSVGLFFLLSGRLATYAALSEFAYLVAARVIADQVRAGEFATRVDELG